MSQIIINVEGMHCPSCEMLVVEDLEELDNITSVEADHKQGKVIIQYTEGLDLDKVKKTIEALEYKVVLDG